MDCRLLDGRLRGWTIQEGVLGLDLMCVLVRWRFRGVRVTDEVTVLDPQQRQRLDRSEIARSQIADYRILNIDFYPRESHLVTFRDPWSFPVLFHPACNGLVRKHLEELAQKVS